MVLFLCLLCIAFLIHASLVVAFLSWPGPVTAVETRMREIAYRDRWQYPPAIPITTFETQRPLLMPDSKFEQPRLTGRAEPA